MSEDFFETFGLGPDDEHITTLDTAGVALGAVQGLAKQTSERDRRIDEVEAENDRLRDEIDEQGDRIEDLETENETLRKRLVAVEEHLDLETSSADPASADD